MRRPGIAETCRALAERWFSLPDAIDAYDAIYSGTAERDTTWPRRAHTNGASVTPALTFGKVLGEKIIKV